MKKALIIIDMQNDFIDQALGTPEAPATVPEVCRLIRDESFTHIYATLDTHTEDYMQTLEGKYLPVVHCVKGTEGWQIRPEVKAELDKRDAVYVEKPTFGSVRLAEMLRELDPDDITIAGLCTDICVVNNALLLRSYLPNTPIYASASACAATTPENHQAALSVMRSCQIEII